MNDQTENATDPSFRRLTIRFFAAAVGCILLFGTMALAVYRWIQYNY